MTPRKPREEIVRLTSAEITAEAAWLLSFRMPAEEVARALGRPANTLATAARRAGNLDIARVFNALDSELRRLHDVDGHNERKRAYRKKVAA